MESRSHPTQRDSFRPNPRRLVSGTVHESTHPYQLYNYMRNRGKMIHTNQAAAQLSPLQQQQQQRLRQQQQQQQQQTWIHWRNGVSDGNMPPYSGPAADPHALPPPECLPRPSALYPASCPPYPSPPQKIQSTHWVPRMYRSSAKSLRRSDVSRVQRQSKTNNKPIDVCCDGHESPEHESNKSSNKTNGNNSNLLSLLTDAKVDSPDKVKITNYSKIREKEIEICCHMERSITTGVVNKLNDKANVEHVEAKKDEQVKKDNNTEKMILEIEPCVDNSEKQKSIDANMDVIIIDDKDDDTMSAKVKAIKNLLEEDIMKERKGQVRNRDPLTKSGLELVYSIIMKHYKEIEV